MLGHESSNRFIEVMRSSEHRYWLYQLARLDHRLDKGHELRHDQQLTCFIYWREIPLGSPDLLLMVPGECLLRRLHTKQRNLNLIRRLPVTAPFHIIGI